MISSIDDIPQHIPTRIKNELNDLITFHKSHHNYGWHIGWCVFNTHIYHGTLEHGACVYNSIIKSKENENLHIFRGFLIYYDKDDNEWAILDHFFNVDDNGIVSEYTEITDFMDTSNAIYIGYQVSELEASLTAIKWGIYDFVNS